MMNRGHLLEMSSSPVQQIIASPSWWNNINTMRPVPPPLPPSTSPPLPQQYPIHQPSTSYYEPSLISYPSLCLPSFVPTWRGDINQEDEEEELPYDQSLSQLLSYGLAGNQDQKDDNLNNDSILHGNPRLFENWGSHQQYLQAPSPNASSSITDTIKEEIVINSPASGNYPNRLFGHHANDDYTVENSAVSRSTNHSSNKSCVTSLGKNNHPDPVPGKKSTNDGKRLGRDPSSECEGSVSGGNSQKRVKNHSTSQNQATFKVRKEKLGDRITTLHQLVSPFGKTDTASVLLEAIGYIRFLRGQIEVLSSPYFGGGGGSSNGSGNVMHQKTEFHGESKIDLRSRGLCLVPISCTTRVGNDDINGAGFWAPALGSPPGLFR